MSRYDQWKLDSGYGDDGRADGCTCYATPFRVIVNRDCPIHGIEVDYEVERRSDDAREAARDIEEDRAEDYEDRDT